MLIFIKTNRTVFSKLPLTISKIKLIKGCNPGINFPAVFLLPLKQTSCIWFKSLFIEFLVIDMIEKTIEWKIKCDESKPFSKIVTTENNIEFNIFFRDLHFLADQHNKTSVPFQKFFIELLLLLQTYILPVITFHKNHLELLNKGIEEQTQRIQQLDDTVKYKETILKQNLDYNEEMISEFLKKNIINYSEHFREFLINSVDSLIRDISSRLKNIKEEIDSMVQKGLINQSNIKRDSRELLFNSLNHFFEMSDVLKSLSKTPSKKTSLPNFQEDVDKFKMMWDDFVKIKDSLKKTQEKLTLAISIKEELYNYFIHLINLKPRNISIADSLSVYYSSKLLRSDSVSEDMASLLTNACLPLRLKYKKFMGDFLNICNVIRQSENLWLQSFNKMEGVLCTLEQKFENNVTLNEDLIRLPITETFMNDFLLKKVKMYFHDHISQMCQEILKYIYIPSDDTEDTQQFLWQCYETYLSSKEIFLCLEYLFKTIFSDTISKLQHILRNPSSIKIKPDVLRDYCSDPSHNHTMNYCQFSERPYNCLDFRVTFNEALLEIQKTSYCLSFTEVCHSLENSYDIIEKIVCKSLSKSNADDIMPVIEFIYLHCNPEVFTDFFIILRMLEVFLPSFLATFGKTGYCCSQFYGVYIVFLENFQNELNCLENETLSE